MQQNQKNNLTNGHIFATLCHVQNLYIVIELYSQSKKRNGVAQKRRAIWTTKERTLRKITKNYKTEKGGVTENEEDRRVKKDDIRWRI